MSREMLLSSKRADGPRTRLLVIAAAAALAAGCAENPTQPAPVGRVISTPATTTPAMPPTPANAQVFVYPAQGQSAGELDRDRYECHRWSVKQSDFDPSLPGLPPQQRVSVVAAGPPPGAAVAAGAVTGAVIGAAVANPWETGEGALLGAAAGAVIGAISETARTSELERREQALASYESGQAAEQEQRADGYRRAITACLEGRGYSVR